MSIQTNQKFLTSEQLNTIVNSWPEGCIGYYQEIITIEVLDKLGRESGYGAIEQLANFIKVIQCDKDIKYVADFKRLRFNQLTWKLPGNFEEVAKIKLDI